MAMCRSCTNNVPVDGMSCDPCWAERPVIQAAENAGHAWWRMTPEQRDEFRRAHAAKATPGA